MIYFGGLFFFYRRKEGEMDLGDMGGVRDIIVKKEA